MEKKGKRIETDQFHFHLPEAIIQHIQSFLNAKEAAQTTLLSKSWYAAWLTRPNLDFDYKDFHRSGIKDRFYEFVEKTVERYAKLNLKIHSLRLRALVCGYGGHRMCSLASKWIVKALKMGATGLDFKIVGPFLLSFVLPDEVFGSEKLVRLSLSGSPTERLSCKIGGKVNCSSLKSLTLDHVVVEGDMIRDIISRSPLLENLSLSLGYYGIRLGSVDGPFNKLKSLLLLMIEVDTLFFDDFSSRFPCLKVLSLHICRGYKGIRISSPLLECISFTGQNEMLRVKFDVPSIRKFTFSGPDIPSLLFETASSEWESSISINCRTSPRATWFLNLNKLLTKLSSSKVSLSIVMYIGTRFYCPENVKGLSRPEVENLTISSPNKNCFDLLEGLFRCCRPIYLTRHWNHELRPSQNTNCDFMEFVYKSVMQQVGLKCDLDQVDVEFFDEAVSAWRPRLIDASTSPGADEQRIRLHLRWQC